jgi:hypothetical protein
MRIGPAKQAQQRRQRLGSQGLLLGRPAQPPQRIAVLTQAHAVKDVVQRVTPRHGVLARRFQVLGQRGRAQLEPRVVLQRA